MNRFAYRTTGLAIKALSSLSKARTRLHGESRIPGGAIIFVVNHFTRLETILMPYVVNRATGQPVWSLADAEFFKGPLANFLDAVGAVSTRDPDRDRLIVKTLLSGEANWIIYPEGGMVKNMKIMHKGRFMISWAGGRRPPHTGAASLALRTEFYRERLRRLIHSRPEEAERLRQLFRMESVEPALSRRTFIVPVNITYYPLRARENVLSEVARRLVGNIAERHIEELMTEGSMFLAGVDIDIRFGPPIDVRPFLNHPEIERDIARPEPLNFDDVLPSRRRMRREALKLTQGCMSAIYGMTTVNHDHLFASILRAQPYARTEAKELRRRVFLAALELKALTGIHLHTGLAADQLHLLTDDRYGIARDFIEIAIEKGNLRRLNGGLIKDRRKFSAPEPFHRVRVANPIAVMANAVEPLTGLQRSVRRIAWLPGFITRRRVREHLQQEALEEFSAEYRAHFDENESKPMEVGRPFLVKGGSRRLGVVLCHGYMAAPLEMRGLAEYLGRRGYWVYVPRLRGHGTSPADLAGRSHEEWIRSVDRGYALISSCCRRVVAGGFSTGAGLVLNLAARVEDLAGVFAVSAPMRLRDFKARFASAVDLWNRIMDKASRNGPKMEFVENQPENPHINYFRNPVSGVREIERLMDDLEPRLERIKIPALILQSSEDPTVDPRGSRRIFDRIGSPDKQYILFAYKRHGILLGEGCERVYRAIGDFLDRLEIAIKSNPPGF
ncbi:MAG: alpha/beta fold hydrolase [Desulfobacterales bacterium]|jgi:esterase/lipase/1-acyl-sn-glycerol-3-phosphate acyltransferase|nr:alpha/beta fold hydrolase [Desulfobacterales bacterium]MCU0584767.1 alpha/beta fold hydrolase [Desulfobacterales bacterium]